MKLTKLILSWSLMWVQLSALNVGFKLGNSFSKQTRKVFCEGEKTVWNINSRTNEVGVNTLIKLSIFPKMKFSLDYIVGSGSNNFDLGKEKSEIQPNNYNKLDIGLEFLKNFRNLSFSINPKLTTTTFSYSYLYYDIVKDPTNSGRKIIFVDRYSSEKKSFIQRIGINMKYRKAKLNFSVLKGKANEKIDGEEFGEKISGFSMKTSTKLKIGRFTLKPSIGYSEKIFKENPTEWERMWNEFFGIPRWEYKIQSILGSLNFSVSLPMNFSVEFNINGKVGRCRNKIRYSETPKGYEIGIALKKK